jgi:aminoglycoside phosphotransferase (APT) family kinase protein
VTIQDGAIPKLSDALMQRRVRELISDRLIPEWFPGSTLHGMSLQYTRYKAGKSHVALYGLQLDPPPDHGVPLITITFGREKLLSRLSDVLASAEAPVQAATVSLPDIPCLAQRFPADYQLPLLWRAADRDRASGLLATMLPGRAPLHVRSIELLRYRPGRRCVLAYTVETAHETSQVIGKLYAQPEQASAVARKLSLLASGASDTLSFPSLLAQPGESALLLMPRLPGNNLGDLLEQTPDLGAATRSVHRAAAALRAFHNVALEGPPSRTLGTELSTLAARIKPLHSVAPELVTPLERLLARIAALVSDVAPHHACAVHGEYKPNQLLIDGDRIAIVDIDRACNGDPAVDVGNFMAVLRKEALVNGHAHLSHADAEFASAYGSAADLSGILDRARVHQAIATLRSLTRSFERRPRQYEMEGDSWKPLALLGETERLLASR